MNRLITANHKQGMLLPQYLDDLIPANHPARFIDELVNQLDFDQLGIEQPTSEQGGLVYDPKILLKVWLYCLCDNVRSFRKIERACLKDIGLLWLTCMQYPDHNTIWRFWVNNKKVIKTLFRKSVEIANDMGLVGVVLHAVDGTKIQAQVNHRGSLHRSALEKILNKLDAELERIDDSPKTIDAESGYVLPEQLTEQKALRDQVKAALQQMDELNRDHINPKDMDSRIMRMDNIRKEFAYNCQTVVDEQSGLIVAADVSQNETDYDLLVPMLDQVKANIGVSAQENLADGGYFSGEQLQLAEEQGHSVLVNIKGGEVYQNAHEGYPKELFTHDKQRDAVICPHGKELTFEGKSKNKSNRLTYRVYRCNNYKDCPYRHLCSNAQSGRRIKINPYTNAIQRQQEKQSHEFKRQLLSRRKAIVEPVFGIIKHNNGFRRFSTKGLSNVTDQWMLICTVFNIQKLYKQWVFCQ